MTMSEAYVTAVDPRSGDRLTDYPDTPVDVGPALVAAAVTAALVWRLTDEPLPSCGRQRSAR